jgi:universal stress protein A
MTGASYAWVYAFEHIVVATDFGSSSVGAVHLAAAMAERFDARLTVLHVVHDTPRTHPAAASVPVLPSARRRELAAKRELDAFLDELAARGPLEAGFVRFGEPASEIVAFAFESACDLVVVGTHGRRRLTRWLLGSVAERVARRAPVPVLTVRADDVPAYA